MQQASDLAHLFGLCDYICKPEAGLQLFEKYIGTS